MPELSESELEELKAKLATELKKNSVPSFLGMPIFPDKERRAFLKKKFYIRMAILMQIFALPFLVTVIFSITGPYDESFFVFLILALLAEYGSYRLWKAGWHSTYK
jgi:hypothetical protein